ncbi:Fur family transcriptional regulator [Shewanella sp. YIC-542]|uniref:Fur family transcriptional regulator n=1 Tax=Shewanella mytili TaxID=3377111 RepID=UPI00398E47DE
MSVESILDHAKVRCKAQGGQFTHKRQIVLAGLLASGKAVSAYELADYCKNELGENIPVMSVYRILEFLQSMHLAHKLSLVNKFAACSHILDDDEHQHHASTMFLICNQCQTIKEVPLTRDIFHGLQKSINQAGFQFKNKQLEFDCICDACAARLSSDA